MMLVFCQALIVRQARSQNMRLNVRTNLCGNRQGGWGRRPQDQRSPEPVQRLLASRAASTYLDSPTHPS